MVAREGKAAVRAEREAKAAAALRHPRCQRIYALARDSGHVYIAYEYVPGRTLREALTAGEIGDRERRRGRRAAARRARACAPARDRPSRRQAVERAARRGRRGIDVRLLDFGLAQMAEFDTLTAQRRRARHARLRLARAPARRGGDRGGRRLGGRRDALGGARERHPFRAATLDRDAARIQSRRPSRSTRVRPDLPPRCSRRSRAPLVARTRRGGPRPRSSPTSCARARRSGARGSKPSAPTHGHAARSRCARAPRARPAGRPRGGDGRLDRLDAALLSRRLAARAGRARGCARGVAPRAGMAFALATAVLPFGNVSLGLALLFAAVACGWVALIWRDPRNGLLFAAGPLLVPLGLARARPARRAARPRRAETGRAAGGRRARRGARRRARHDDLPFDGSAAAAQHRRRAQHLAHCGRRRACATC